MRLTECWTRASTLPTVMVSTASTQRVMRANSGKAWPAADEPSSEWFQPMVPTRSRRVMKPAVLGVKARKAEMGLAAPW